MPARRLEAEKITAAVEQLHRRIIERFPDSGLGKTVAELRQVSEAAAATTANFRAPILWLRIVVGLLIFLMAAGILATVTSFHMPERFDFFQLVQVIESGVNDAVFVGIAVFFLLSLETRIKRNRGLTALHGLRSIAHVIDMQQLTKDPEQLHYGGPRTASSPREHFSAFELSRYLDYCSEALSLIGKIAALYGQDFHDSVIIATVNEIEDLTGSISGKIWQKLMIVHQSRADV